MGKIDIILKKIRESFIVSDTQIVLFIFIIICFIAVLAIAPFIISLLWKRRVHKKAQKYYEELVEYYQLDKSDEKVINRLSRYLKHPWKKYLLITNPRAYFSAMSRMYKEFEAFRASAQALSQKIVLDEHDQNQQPTHTAQFKKNHQIILIYENRPIIARILSSGDDGFICEVEMGSRNLSVGLSVLLLYPYGNGLSVGKSIVDKVNDSKVKFISTDMDEPKQIEYNDLAVPVFLRKISSASEFISAELRQINGKQFYLHVSGHGLKKHDDVKIYFSKGKGSVPINAEIVVIRNKQIVADAGYFVRKE